MQNRGQQIWSRLFRIRQPSQRKDVRFLAHHLDRDSDCDLHSIGKILIISFIFFVFLVKIRNFGPNTKFWSKYEILVKLRNFGKTSKFWSKFEISVKLRNFG